MTRGAALTLYWLERLAPLAVFAACMALTFEAHREQLSPDGTSYIRRAMYLVDGDLRNSASAYWSPMISWCVAPLLAGGVDGVHAIHYVLAFWGGVSVATFGVLLRAASSLTAPWRTLAATAFAVVAARGCMRHTSPDTMLVALLLLYFALTCRRELLERRWMALGAGALGGLAFLAKAYALPYIAVHLPMTILMLAWVHRRELGTRRDALRKSVVTALVAAGGFAAVALPWVGVLTWKHGTVTVTSVGARSHALAGPEQMGEYFIEFFLPADPMIMQWEEPERLRYSYWSPLQSRDNFLWQVKLMAKNAAETFRIIGEASGYAIWAGMALAVTAMAGLTHRGEGRWRVGWMVLSLAVYCAGFCPMLLTARYLIEFASAMGLLLCAELAARFGIGHAWRGWPWVRGVLLVGVIVAFVTPAMAGMRRDPVEGAPSTKPARRVAGIMEKRGIAGPIASPYVPQSRMLAFFAGKKEIGFPDDVDVEVVERRLREADVGVVLIVAGSTRGIGKGASAEATQKLLRRPGWRRVVKEGATELWAPAWK